MKSKMFKILGYWKVWIVIFIAIVALLAIEPKLEADGALVTRTVAPASQYVPMGSVIIEINGIKINNALDFYAAEREFQNQTVYIKYKEKTFPFIYQTNNAYPFRIVEKSGLTVTDLTKTNVDFGIDMMGGTRVLLRPERNLNPSETENLVSILAQRLNVYGLKDIPVVPFRGTDGTQYIRIEFAGVSREEVESLLSQQGKFEARIGNETIFTGEDLTGVCIGGEQCVRTIRRVTRQDGGEAWQYSLQIDINQAAADRFAQVTDGLKEECVGMQCYLNETLDFYIDYKPVEGGSLNIVSNLKGKSVTTAVITGTRVTQTETEEEIKKMQAILQSGSLPVILYIEKMDTISPTLGKEFARNIFLVFMIAIILVNLSLFIRYKNIKVMIPMMLTAMFEVFATLGIAALIGWTMDLPSIAGLLAAVGTGLDDQIVIVDEMFRGKSGDERASVKNRMKRAFFIVIASFATSVAAMIPLAFAGAGILKGFAITTIIAVSVGVFFSRPAFASIIEKVIKD